MKVFPAPGDLTLGDQYNFAVARAAGEVICVWDDDDLSDPLRLKASVRALVESRLPAAFLKQLLIWWPSRRLLALSRKRIWEMTMCIWRNQHGIYPAYNRGEDTVFVKQLVSRSHVALIEHPDLYCYVVTGRNTWSAPHFEKMFSSAERTFSGTEYDILLDKLATRIPIGEYQKVLVSGSLK